LPFYTFFHLHPRTALVRQALGQAKTSGRQEKAQRLSDISVYDGKLKNISRNDILIKSTENPFERIVAGREREGKVGKDKADFRKELSPL
jgi:hypothetical protein